MTAFENRKVEAGQKRFKMRLEGIVIEIGTPVADIDHEPLQPAQISFVKTRFVGGALALLDSLAVVKQAGHCWVTNHAELAALWA